MLSTLNICMLKKILLLLFIFSLLGCNLSFDTESSKVDNNTIVTSFTVLNDLVDNLAPNHVEVKSLIGVGLDPHSYTPTPSDVSLLSSADMIFAMGLDLEASMSSLFESLSESKPVYKVGNLLETNSLIESDYLDDSYDPHVWFDLDLWSDLTFIVQDILVDNYPEYKDEIISNSQSYIKNIEDLNRYTNEKLDSLPKENRILVTAHDAFSYFTKKYDFQLYTLQGISTESDYSIKDLNDIVDLVVSNKIKSIFTESSVSKQAIFTIQEKSLSEGWSVNIGGELYSDSLGLESENHNTYFQTFKHNVDTIVNNLK